MYKLKILFVASSPLDEQKLSVSREFQDLYDFIQSGTYKNVLDLHPLFDPSLDKLIEVIAEYKPHILHFAGHGVKKGIILTDKRENGIPLEHRDFLSLLEKLPIHPKLIVLNACYTEQQAHNIAQSIGCAIGIKNEIADAIALKFANVFYKMIASECTIRNAFDISIINLKQYPTELETRQYKIYTKRGSNADQVSPLKNLFKGEVLLRSPELWNNVFTILDFAIFLNREIHTLHSRHLDGLNILLEEMQKNGTYQTITQYNNLWDNYNAEYQRFWEEFCHKNQEIIKQAFVVLQTIEEDVKLKKRVAQIHEFYTHMEKGLLGYANLHAIVARNPISHGSLDVQFIDQKVEAVKLSPQVFSLTTNARSLQILSQDIISHMIKLFS